MAVQQNRKTPSKRDMRRAHDALSAKTITTDSVSGKRHLRHNLSKDGFYRGKQIFTKKSPAEESAE